jgi:hypothetical protein
MFHPVDQPMVRGWVGRIEDDHVVHLAAQTLESFFTGGGKAREHAVYPLAQVQLLAPVLHPPSIRVFDEVRSFEFVNPAAVIGPHTEVEHGTGEDWLPLDLQVRLAAVVGGHGEIAALTSFADWRAPLPPPKDRDFAFGLGPAAVTLDEASDAPEAGVRVFDDEVLRRRFEPFDWSSARDFAAEGTMLRAGDLLVGPAVGVVEGIEPATVVEIDVEGIGTFSQSVHPEVAL